MYLSKVILEPRSVKAQCILSDLYRQHQFVSSAFPDKEPGARGTASSACEERPSALFRLEAAEHARRPYLLVQSPGEPDWERSGDIHPDVVLTACTKSIAPVVTADDRLRFRLRANPTKMCVDGDPAVRTSHRRCGLYKEVEQLDWLERQGMRGGFRVVRDTVLVIPLGLMTGMKPGAPDGVPPRQIKCLCVDFHGTLVVTDPNLFHSALENGVGRGKAWGCGLLSVARTS